MTDKTIVRYKFKKKIFEIICKPKKITLYKEKKINSLDKILISDEIYSNFNKNKKASENDLLSVFKTKNKIECIKLIIEKGTYQLTTEEIRENIKINRLKLIGYIHNNYINPKSKKPYSLGIIESSLNESKIRIDPNILPEIIFKKNKKKILNIIPLKPIEKNTFDITILIKFWNLIYKNIKSYVEIISKQYNGNKIILKLSSSKIDLVLSNIEQISKGDYEINLENDN